MKKNYLKQKYQGVISVAFTPCNQLGAVDCQAMEKYCSILSKEGCSGIFVLGSTGCLPLLDEDDRLRIVSSARLGTKKEVTLFAGISGMGYKEAIKYSRQVADKGADVAVLMAPFFLKLSQEQLYTYVCEIADNSPIPISLYHHLRMPTSFEVSTVAKLAKHPNIIGIKDTSCDMLRFKELISSVVYEDFAVFQGHERLILQSLQAGASGCLTALAGLMPKWHIQLVENWLNENIKQAEKYQNLITKMTETLLMNKETGQSMGHFEYTLKYAAHCLGWLDNPTSIIKGWQPNNEFKQKIKITLKELTKIIHMGNWPE